MDTPHLGTFTVKEVKGVEAGDYDEIPDVVFVCVKGYSIGEITPFLQKHCGKKTIVIPILNIYGTGSRLQEVLPESLVLD